MAFDVVMFGSLSIPEQHTEEWLTSTIERFEYPWLEELGGSEVVHESPESLLAFLEGQRTEPHEMMSMTLVESHIAAQCYASEDLFRQTSQAMALLFASAASFGGVGELCFSGYRGIRFGERLVVRGGRTAFGSLNATEVQKLEQHPLFLMLDAKIHERYDGLVGRITEGAIDPRRSTWAVNPFTGRRVRVAIGA